MGGENGTDTATVSVAAGSSVSFTSDVAVYHDGPVSVYMAKAPTTAAAFDGSGDVYVITEHSGLISDHSI